MKNLKLLMGMAYGLAEGSKSPRTKHGTMLLDPEFYIIATGVNGLPKGFDDSLLNDRDFNRFHIHAEMNAVLNLRLGYRQPSLCLCTGFPCLPCTLALAQVGVKHIAFGSTESSMLGMNEIDDVHFVCKSLGILLESISIK